MTQPSSWHLGPKVKMETPLKVVEKDQAKILWDFPIQTDKLVIAYQPNIVGSVVSKASSESM